MADNKWEELVVCVDNIADSVEIYHDDVEGFCNNLHEKIKPIFGDNKHYTILGQIITKKNLQSVFLPDKNAFKDYISRTTESRYSDIFKKFLFEKNNGKSEVFVLNYRQEIESKTSLPKQFIEDNNINSLCVVPIHWENRIAGLIISFSESETAYQKNSKIFFYASKILSRTLKRRRDANRKNVLLDLSKTLFKSDKDSLHDKIFKILEDSYKHLDICMSTKNVFMYCFYDTEIVDITLETTFNFGLINKIKTESIPEKYSAIIGISNYIMEHPIEVINLETKCEIKNWLKEHDISGNIDDLESLLVTPMRIEPDFVIGVFILFNTKKFTYDQSDCDFVNDISDQAAVIIEGLRIRERLKSIIKINKHISANMNQPLEEIYEFIHNNAKDVEKDMFIAMFNEKENLIEFPFFYLGDKRVKFAEREFGNGRTEWVIKNKKSLIIKTKRESIEWYKKNNCTDYMANPLASWIGAPIMINDKVLGIIAAFHEEKDYIYDKQDLEILELFGSQIAIALGHSSLYREIEKSYQEAEEAKKRLEIANQKIAKRERMLTKSMIASDFVHRLNNMAGTTIPWIEEIEEELENEEINKNLIKECLNNIRDENKELLTTVNTLDKFDKKRNVNMNHILISLIKQAKTQYYSEIEREVVFIDDSGIDESLYPVCAADFPLAHAIYDVIANGIESNIKNNGKKLTINANNYTKNNLSFVKIEIIDEGIGIAKEDQEEIFEPFVSTKEGTYSGYGLWRARGLFEDYNGEITVSSDKDKGAIFTILLPKSHKE